MVRSATDCQMTSFSGTKQSDAYTKRTSGGQQKGTTITGDGHDQCPCAPTQGRPSEEKKRQQEIPLSHRQNRMLRPPSIAMPPIRTAHHPCPQGVNKLGS